MMVCQVLAQQAFVVVELSYELSDAELAAFARDGVIPLRGVLDQDTLSRVQQAANRARNGPGGFWYSIYLWRQDVDFRACALNQGLAAIAAKLLGASKLNLLYDQLFIKPPKGEPTPWHHDLPYWPIDGDGVVSLWIALSDVDAANGGLEFIRGSHRWGRRFRNFTVDRASERYLPLSAYDDVESMPDFDQNRDRYDVLNWDLAPGDALAFHALTLHHAPANSSARYPREGYALRYMSEAVRYRESDGMNKHVFNHALRNGDGMESEQYPTVYEAGMQ
ncbi:MAG: hypothetical protein CMO26_15245 [Thiotrichales bacterium]|mgnify:FL=1|nr:hypothetical protein [Thiotrichales bacterium]|tara:strand:+ start:49 stop:882 length:834 start_codon:yes stop_codon:yes gene_type:complete